MASLSAPEEVFRFSIVRNPEPASDEAIRDGVLRIVPTDAEENHPQYSALLQLRRQGMPRKGIVAHAAGVMAAPEYLGQFKSLSTPIFLFSDRLYALRARTASKVRDLIQEVFGTVVRDQLESDRRIIADALIVASVDNPPATGLRGRLMRALRAIEVIRRLADCGDSEVPDPFIERLMNATLLLPADLFPIPADNWRAEENRKEYERRKEQLEKEKERAQVILDKLAGNAGAALELSGTLTMHLFEQRDPVFEGPSLPSRAIVLPLEKVEKLSEASKKIVLEDVGVAPTSVDVPFVVEQLEKRNILLGHELATNYGDLLLDAGPFNLPGCGDCNPVVLPEPKPENDFTPETRGEVELVGIQDLLIVRQRLREYRAGEIAHIENVLKGEMKSKRHRKLERTETTLVEETETENETENELQTTDKYELQTESSRVIQEDKKAEAGVTVTASYGSVDIEAHGNYASRQHDREPSGSVDLCSRRRGSLAAADPRTGADTPRPHRHHRGRGHQRTRVRQQGRTRSRQRHLPLGGQVL